MTTINTRLGKVAGIDQEGCLTFLGLPFAAPPVGALRWKPPAPAPAWTGVFDATRLPNRCPQPPYPDVLGVTVRGEESEDCLYLNIHTPADDAAGRPVLFWIHGGAHIQGSANEYDGAVMAKNGEVVVVAINYRLGAFGFADFSALGPEYAGSGSRGYEDQIAALRWVHENIADYGGDPGCVTIMGESAGAASVVALQGAPSAEGLFHRAVAFSPADISPHPAPDAAAALAGRLGCSLDELEARAQAIPAGELMLMGVTGALPCVQSVDGVVITERPVEAIARKGAAGPPLILGSTRDEGSYLAGLAALTPGAFEVTAGNLSHLVRPADPEGYVPLLEKATPGASELARMQRAWQDMFRSVCLRVAEAATRAGAGGWVYNFEVPTEHELGITHGADIPFTFNMFEMKEPAFTPFHEDSADVRALAREWLAFLVRFARTGHPNGGALPGWPRYDAERRACLVFDDAPHVANGPDDADALARYELV